MASDIQADSKPQRGEHKNKQRPLSHELLHGHAPAEFGAQARALAEAEALNPQVRERLKHQLVEHLKSPVDTPSWGPDWVKKIQQRAKEMRRTERKEPLSDEEIRQQSEQNDAQAIVRNLEKSRQVAQYRPLYVAAAVLAVVIAFAAMFVDYQIIAGDIWTRALANQFMIVPDALKDSVIFKSLQVVFAALAVHFMLKITGAYGRNALITTAFAFTLIMIVSLGYLVAYNNMDGATSAQYQQHQEMMEPASNSNSIDSLLGSMDSAQAAKPAVNSASMTPAVKEISLPLPKVSLQSLAAAQSWLWFCFASVIFFIITTICALYMEIGENNVRNYLIAKDYKTRRQQYAQLQLLELASREQTESRGLHHVAEV